MRGVLLPRTSARDDDILGLLNISIYRCLDLFGAKCDHAYSGNGKMEDMERSDELALGVKCVA